MSRGSQYYEGLEFRMTCSACPEQYEVYGPVGHQVAYVRLRHGELRVDIPVCGGETVLSTQIFDCDGHFNSQNERVVWLTHCAKIINLKYDEIDWDEVYHEGGEYNSESWV